MTLSALRLALKRLVPQSPFARSVATLVTGTGLAQALPLVLAPVLTRLYSPEDFGAFALYASMCAILAVLVTGKYELAIVVPKRDSEAINIAAVTAMLSLLISLVFLVLVALRGQRVAEWLNHPEVAPWLYFVPVTTLIVGWYHALNAWTHRRARYSGMATSRVVQSGAAGASQLVAGFVRSGPVGLIVGQMAGQLLATLFLAASIPAQERRRIRSISVKRMVWVARKHLDYPKYMVPGQAMSVGAAELPLLLLSVVFGAGVAGYYALAQRVMAAPLSLVASAVGDVYRQKAAERFAREGECRDLFRATLTRLLLFAFLPALPVLLFGPSLFAFVFGDGWRSAGEVAALLSVLVFFQTVSSPLSSTLLLRGWLKLEFMWQFSRLALVALIFYLCHVSGLDRQTAIAMYVGVFSVLYILHTYWQYRAARG